MKRSWIRSSICILLLWAVSIIGIPSLSATVWAGRLPSGSQVLNDNWEIFGKEKEVIFEDFGGVTFLSLEGNNSSGIKQRVDIDVSAYSKVMLYANFTVYNQNLSGTGWQGREAPLFIFVTYTDVNGVMHDELRIYPGCYPGEDQSRRMYWKGFYYLDPVSPSMSKFGLKVEAEEGYEFTVDLKKEIYPQPQIIHYVGAGGSGWPDRESYLNEISLTLY